MKFNFEYIYKIIVLICLCIISISLIVIAKYISYIPNELNNLWSSISFLKNILDS